ncbi:Ltp family lipoprotein [Microbacterium aurum]
MTRRGGRRATGTIGKDPADAEFAHAYLEQNKLVAWNAEPAECAKSYVDMTSSCRDGLHDQLTSDYGEQFTPEQANAGLAAVGH